MLFHIVAIDAIDDHPSCFRYPRGNGVIVQLPLKHKGIPLAVGKGRILIEGERVTLLGYGVVKITLAHNSNDFDVRKRHNLRFINIFIVDGKINSLGVEFARMPR